MKKFLVLFLSAFLVIGGAYLILSATSAPADLYTEVNPNYMVGDHVFDTGGNEWIYMGKADLIVGQISPDLKLLTVFVCGKERILYGLHPEEIPKAERGDTWKLYAPAAELLAWLTKEGFVINGMMSEWCNATGWDPPKATVPYLGGTLVCARYYCGDAPSIPVHPRPAK